MQMRKHKTEEWKHEKLIIILRIREKRFQNNYPRHSHPSSFKLTFLNSNLHNKVNNLTKSLLFVSSTSWLLEKIYNIIMDNFFMIINNHFMNNNIEHFFIFLSTFVSWLAEKTITSNKVRFFIFFKVSETFSIFLIRNIYSIIHKKDLEQKFKNYMSHHLLRLAWKILKKSFINGVNGDCIFEKKNKKAWFYHN